MMTKTNTTAFRCAVSTMLAFALFLPMTLLPFAAAPATAQFGRQNNQTPKQGMSLGKKVLLLGGAALLFYLFKRNQAKRAEQQAMMNNTQTGGVGNPNTRNANMQRTPQLYRSETSGRVYYRDPQNPKRVIYLTVPKNPVQVPADQLQRYAPNYQQYQNKPVPTVPQGQPSRNFFDFDRSALPAGSAPGPIQ